MANSWDILKYSRSETKQEVDSKQDSKIAVVKRRYPDNKYDLAVDNIGAVGVSLKRRPTVNPTDKYSVGDTVVIDFIAGKIAYSQIRCRAAISIPEEEEYIFGIEVNTDLYITQADSYLYFFAADGTEDESSKFSIGGGNCAGVATDGTHIFICNTYSKTIEKYTMDGTFVTSWPNYNITDYPWDIAVAGDYLFAQSVIWNRCVKYTKSGDFVSYAYSGTLARGVCYNGTYVFTISSNVSGWGITRYNLDFSGPLKYSGGLLTSGRAIEADSSGNIYWGNYGTSNIYKMDVNLNLLATSIETLSNLETIAIDEDNNIFAIQADGTVKVFDTSLNYSSSSSFSITAGRGATGKYLF